MRRRLAARLGRAVLVVAVLVLLVGFAIATLGMTVATWPYRKLRGPSRRRAQLEATLELVSAIATLGALLQPDPREER